MGIQASRPHFLLHRDSIKKLFRGSHDFAAMLKVEFLYRGADSQY